MTAERSVAVLEHHDHEPVSATGASDGWTGAAIAVHSVLAITQPMFMRLEAPGYEPILIDFRHNAFEWSTPLAEFPPQPLAMVIETEPTTFEAAPLFELPARNLDGLLWAIGLNSFTGQRASWLPPEERYRLTRWPDLSEHEPTAEQLHMTATLTTAFLSLQDLAAVTGCDEGDAQQLVNALSLLGILEVQRVLVDVATSDARREL